jgi:hypothetical protein
VPLVSVPVELPNNWMNEGKSAAAPVQPAAPAPPRFLSEAENEANERGKADFFFTSTTPAVATSVTISAPPIAVAEVPDSNFERAQTDRTEPLTIRFEEPLEEEPVAQQTRDFAADFAETPIVEAAHDFQNAEPAASIFNETADEEQKDLDVPAFMRRHKF